jgi:ankyrin repeat protein
VKIKSLVDSGFPLSRWRPHRVIEMPSSLKSETDHSKDTKIPSPWSTSHTPTLVILATLFILIGAVSTSGMQGSLIDAAGAGDLSRVKALLADGVDVNTKGNGGLTALMQASQNGHIKVVRALLAVRADVNAQTAEGETALIVASQNGQLEIVQALVAAKADVNVRGAIRTTALIQASKNGHAEVVRMLLAAKADANARTTYGETALMQALWAPTGGDPRLARRRGRRKHSEK